MGATSDVHRFRGSGLRVVIPGRSSQPRTATGDVAGEIDGLRPPLFGSTKPSIIRVDGGEAISGSEA